MDAAALATLVNQLCGDDFYQHSTAKNELEKIFTPAVIVADEAGVRDFAGKAMARQAPEVARRFCLTQLEIAARQEPAGFLGTSHAAGCARLIADEGEDVGIAERASRVLAVAAGSDDHTLEAALATQVPEILGSTALLRLAEAGLALAATQSRAATTPALAGGFIAGRLGAALSAAVDEEDVLLLVCIATLAVSAARYSKAASVLGEKAVAFINDVIGDPDRDPILHPYCLRGVGGCIALDPSPGHANTTAFAPGLRALVARPVPRDLTAWSVAVAAALSTPTGATLVNEAGDGAQQRVVDAVGAAIRSGSAENVVAAVHVIEAAAACRPLSGTSVAWIVRDKSAFDGIVKATAAAGEETRAAAWLATTGLLTCARDAQSVGATAVGDSLAPLVAGEAAPAVLRRLRIALTTLNPGLPDEAPILDAAVKAGRAVLAVEDTFRPTVSAEDWDGLLGELKPFGVVPVETEMAL